MIRTRLRPFLPTTIVIRRVPSLPVRSTPHWRAGLRGVLIALITTAAIGVIPSTGHSQPGTGAPAAAAPDDLERQIAAARARLEVATEQYNAVRADIAATRSRVAALRRGLSALTRRLAAGRANATAIVVAAYKSGLTGDANALLAAASPEEFLDRLQLLDHVTAARDREIVALLNEQREVSGQQTALEALVRRGVAQERARASLLGSIRAQLRHLTSIRDLRIEAANRGTARVQRARGTAPVHVDRRRGTRVGHHARRPTTGQPTAGPGAGGYASSVVRFAFRQLGTWYQFGAAGPHSYDCSGLALAAWRAAGVYLPHNAARQWSSVRHLDRSDLTPGDLVFYYRDIHHVAIYIGGGQIIHAPGPGERVTRAPVDLMPVYGYGRPG
jgi:cell wall-associated NlpC family hydrolase